MLKIFLERQIQTRTFLVLLLLTFFAAQAQVYSFEKLTTRDGLPESFIKCIHQDSRGFIWIGTNDGLCRYDGYDFRIYNIDNRKENWLKSNLIISLSEDQSGDLWIGTSDDGMYRYDQNRDFFEKIKMVSGSDTTLYNFITKSAHFGEELLVGSRGGLTIFTRRPNGGIKASYKEERILEIPYRIEAFEQQGADSIWIGTENGLYLYTNDSLGKRRFVHYPKPGNDNLWDITRFRDGLLIAAADGIFYFNENQGFSFVNDLYTRKLLLDRHDNLWVACIDGLIILKPDRPGGRKFSFSEKVSDGWEINNISSNLVTVLYEDRFGNIWIGTNNGINKYNPNQKPFALYQKSANPGSISSNIIRFLYEDEPGNIWIGTDGGGISFLPMEMAWQKKYNQFDYVPVSDKRQGDVAFCIAEVDINMKTYILVGTELPSKLVCFKMMDQQPVRQEIPSGLSQISNSVFDIVDDKGNIWLGTFYGGLYRYDKKTGVAASFRKADGCGLCSDIVRDVLIDCHDNLWIATSQGLNFLASQEKSRTTPVFKEYTCLPYDSTSLAYDYILTLFESQDSSLWIGTMGGGLNKYLGDGKFMTIDMEDGLPSNVIKGILEDSEGKLWISSNEGLSKLDPVSLKINNFDLYDGLQDFEFGEHACVKLPDGEMLFGGVRGFNAFYPEQIYHETTIPEMVFTDLQVHNQPVAVGEEIGGKVILNQVINETEKIRLKFKDNSFSIYFAGLHYSAPQKNQYKYILEGFDADWIWTSPPNIFAKYSNLNPGQYVFRFIASNNDGVWNPEPKTLTIRVMPPAWLSIPALLVYLAFLIIIALFFNRFTFIRIRQKSELLMEHFEQEKIMELSQMKLRFYTNISHEFKTPLTLIIGPVNNLIKQFGSILPVKANQSLQTIKRNSGILLRLINQLMDFRKIEQEKMMLSASYGNIYMTVKEIYESFEELAFQKEIIYNFTSFSKEIMIWYDYEKIERILYNLLSNAFKNTRREGKVNLIIQDHDEDFIEIRVEDTGVGIFEDEKNHIFERFYSFKNIIETEVGSTGIGLSLSKGLVELHKGVIDFESEPGVGSTFFIRLRKGDAHLSEKEKSLDQPVIIPGRKENEFISEEDPEGKEDQSAMQEQQDKKLLIVEDNFELRSFLQEGFMPHYHVNTAEDGECALEQIQLCQPDLIISDVMMPNMDGFELCRRIKSEEATSHIPVILLSAKSNEEAQIKGYSLGADAYVPKPFNFDILCEQVKSIFTQRRQIRLRFKQSLDVTPSEIAMTIMDEKFLEKTCELVRKNMSDPEYSVKVLSMDYGITLRLMNRKLKALIGLTANAYIRSIRLKWAAQLLSTGRYTISEVTYDVGFQDLKHFRTSFKEEFNMTPNKYKQQYTKEV